VTLGELNALDEAQFAALLGPVYANAPWAPRRAWTQKPFASIEELVQALADAVLNSSADEQLALVRAQPELSGKLAGAGRPPADPSGELERLGFLNLDRGHFERIAELNRRYRQRFGFACVVALPLHASRASVMADMRRRLGNQADAELSTALEQISRMARARVEKLLGDR
jgi:OHCU decarboxylase